LYYTFKFTISNLFLTLRLLCLYIALLKIESFTKKNLSMHRSIFFFRFGNFPLFLCFPLPFVGLIYRSERNSNQINGITERLCVLFHPPHIPKPLFSPNSLPSSSFFSYVSTFFEDPIACLVVQINLTSGKEIWGTSP